MIFCATGVAAAYAPLPACDATIVHVPAAINCADTVVVPETVQKLGVLVEKLTVRPESDEAVPVKVSGVPTYWAAMAPKVMVWGFSAAFTWMFCETGVAAE